MNTLPTGLRIGLDFDGTVALYDEAFHRGAVGQFGMPDAIKPDKLAVRRWLRARPEGEQRWIELQGVVYGTRMSEAKMAPGLDSFLLFCRDNGIHVSIISHKTEFPVIGPRTNLREAARRWMEQVGLHLQFGIRPEDVFFESTRREKIRRIGSQQCVRFVDDLEEVFLEPSFPKGVEKLLYAPGCADDFSGEMKIISSWEQIHRYLLIKPHGDHD